jgi:hypothetical protein
MRRPVLADALHVLGTRLLSQAIRATDRVLNSQIQFGKDIWSPEPEHEEHLNGPTADSFHLHESGDDLVVRQMIDGIRRDRNNSTLDLGGEILEVGELLTRETCGSECFPRRGENFAGCRRPIAIESAHAPEYRRRSLAGELLIDDRPNECVEMRPFTSLLEAAGPDAVDHYGQHGIDVLEVLD